MYKENNNDIKVFSLLFKYMISVLKQVYSVQKPEKCLIPFSVHTEYVIQVQNLKQKSTSKTNSKRSTNGR